MDYGSKGYLTTLFGLAGSNALVKATQGGSKEAGVGKAKNNKRIALNGTARLASMIMMLLGGVFLWMIFLGAIPAYLTTSILVVPMVMAFLNYLVFIILLPIINDAQLMRLLLPNDRDNYLSIIDKYLKVKLFLWFFPVVLIFAAVLTIGFYSIFIQAGTWLIYHFTPQGSLAGDLIAYVLIALMVLAIALMTVRAVFSTIVDGFLNWTNMEYAFIGNPVAIANTTETIFFKIMPIFQSLKALAPAMNKKNKKAKDKDLEQDV